MEHRASWLINDNDDTDTDYSADDTITIQAEDKRIGEEVAFETIPGSNGEERTIPTGEHVGVG
jgi:hypothetical protein